MPGTSAYDISGTNPLIPLQLLPNATVNWTFSLAITTTHRLLAIFTDPGLTPQASVSATLSFGSYVETKLTGADNDPDFGQVFFAGLQDKNHSLDATASGFKDYKGKVNVSGYTQENVTLQPE